MKDLQKSNQILKLGLVLKSNQILKLGLMFKSNLMLKLGFILKSNLILKLVFILKLNLILKLGFILKFVYIQNFELILNILEHLKPSISSLKQPGRLVACYLEITPISRNRVFSMEAGCACDFKISEMNIVFSEANNFLYNDPCLRTTTIAFGDH